MSSEHPDGWYSQQIDRLNKLAVLQSSPEDPRRKDINLLFEIFTDIRLHNPRIREYPYSQVKILYNEQDNVVNLIWGSKFNLTPEEKEFLNSHKFRLPQGPESSGRPEIVFTDFYTVSAQIIGPLIRIPCRVGHNTDDSREDVIYSDFRLDQFFLMPEIILPAIRYALLSPFCHQRVLKEGVDYWIDPRQQHTDGIGTAGR